MSSSIALLRPSPAAWVVKRQWMTVIGFALIPVLFTALGSAVGQVLAVGDVGAALIVAAAASISAVLGLIVMRLSGQSRKSFGYRWPTNLRAAWCLVPPAMTIGLVLVTAPPSSLGSIVGAYLVLSIAVAINEETWFRGIVLAVLRPAGIRTAIVGSSVLFGVMHLANLAGGASLFSSLLQMVFALIFGVVAAELAIVTGSLWPAILWHASWDFVNYLGGNETIPLALVGVGLSCAVMIAYAMRLWRRAKRMSA